MTRRHMNRVLPRSFFRRPAPMVARDLLGKFLVRKRGRSVEALMITDVEAYEGPDDKASHAHRGMTPRNAPMFGGPGRWYVYFVYGMHWMLNVVTGSEGFPAAVLIRGVEGLPGPARLTKKLRINGRFNGRPAARTTGLWIEDRGTAIAPPRIRRGPRIGVAYAGAWAKKPYRFYVQGSRGRRTETGRRPRKIRGKG